MYLEHRRQRLADERRRLLPRVDADGDPVDGERPDVCVCGAWCVYMRRSRSEGIALNSNDHSNQRMRART